MSLTAVSLFAGVGGFDLALQRAGVTVSAAVEIDEPARGVLADRFPETTLFPDVTKVTADDLRAAGFVPRRGIVTAGFPCQDLSVAGRRAGMGEGTRSGLYWHIVRLLADLRPAWVFLENVPGLLSAVCKPECPGGCMATHGGAMGLVLGSLGDLGYGFAYRVLDAQFTGVPQRRRRVFIVGCLGDTGAASAQVLLEPEGGGGNPPQGQQAGQGVAATLTAGVARPGVSAPGRRQEDDVNIIPFDTTQITSAKNYSSPKLGDPCHPLAAGMHAPAIGVLGHRTHALTAEGADASEDGSGRGTPVIAFAWQAGGKNGASGAYAEEMSPTLPKSQTMAVQTETTVRRLTPLECERLQGFPDGWTQTSNGVLQADGPRYRQMGNAVAVPCVEWTARRIVARFDSQAVAA